MPDRVIQRLEPMEKGQAERLVPLLEEVLAEAALNWSDLKALDVHARVQSAGPRTGLPGLAELEQAVRNFDFVHAAALCARLLDALADTGTHTGG